MIAFLSVLIGWIVQGLIGLGSGIISTAILLFFFNAKEVVVSLSIIALTGTIYLSWKNFRGNFFLKEILILSIFSFIGAGIGSFLLEKLNPKDIELIFGIVITLTGIYDFYSQKKKIFIHSKHKTIFGVFTGTVGGIISGLIGGAGPLYALYLNQTIHNKNDFKFIISFVFVILNIERILFYLVSPELRTLFNWEIVIPGMVGVVIGAYLGNYLTGKLPTQKFKELVSLSIVIFGVYFIFKSF